MKPPSRRLRLAALIAIVGCHDPLGSPSLPTGNFRLVAVDGSPLPFRGPNTITVRGSITLASGASYTLTQIDSALAGGSLTEFRSAGTWVLSDNAIVLRHGGNLPVYFGVISNYDTVRVNLESHVNTYLRQ